MLILPIEDARPGMKLAAPVRNPEQPEQDLLKRGYVMEAPVLQRMRAMGIDTLYVDFPGLDDLDRHLSVQLSKERQVVYSQIKQTLQSVQQRTRPNISYTDYYAGTRELVLTLLTQGQHPVYIDTMSRMGDDMVGHATAVAHLSLMLGLKLERYLIAQRSRLAPAHARDVVNLGVAGMLHDLGKARLPESCRRRHVTDAPEAQSERAEWENHPRISYEMVRGGIEASAASAILHHHQHFDGSGFAKVTRRDGTVLHPAGEQIHVFARIVMIADLYDRLLTGSNKRRRSNLEVLWLMKTQYGAWCDPVILETLQKICPPFPPGTRLTLSDGTGAVVVDVDAETPCQPIVKRLTSDSEQMQLAEESLDLSQPGAPAIVTAGGIRIGEFLPSVAAAISAA